MRDGQWLVLARTKFMLNDLEDVLYRKGLFYKNKFKKSYEQDLYEAITDWEKLREGASLPYDKVQHVLNYIGPRNLQKEKIFGMVKDGFYNITQLKKDFGLMTQSVWYEALDEAPFRRAEYIRKMRSNGEQLSKKPRILLSTIHGVKGGEEQNVVLLSDLRLNTQKGYERNPDDENRLFYVGATRTKQHLHIVEPKDFYKSYPL